MKPIQIKSLKLQFWTCKHQKIANLKEFAKSNVTFGAFSLKWDKRFILLKDIDTYILSVSEIILPV